MTEPTNLDLPTEILNFLATDSQSAPGKADCVSATMMSLVQLGLLVSEVENEKVLQ